MDEAIKKAIETYQCPGCVAGSNTKCGAFKQGHAPTAFECTAHVPGTAMSRIGTIMLGMPKGFCRVGPRREDEDSRHTVQIHPQFPVGWYTATRAARSTFAACIRASICRSSTSSWSAPTSSSRRSAGRRGPKRR